ncbi:hypothetical protein D6V39_18495 [Vibrio cholerae]|nr:hypothetical protein [Vibrio cholerae]TOK33141.1 hypothetical protein CGI19_19375 [Vibrio parahaemolyticus]TOK52035.1 hypothetical protein CGI16_22820 [Vibrio parahaemolyticus]BCT98660.1 hypothetical protein [uncultured bacterium]
MTIGESRGAVAPLGIAQRKRTSQWGEEAKRTRGLPLGGWEDAKRPGGIEKGGFPPSGAGFRFLVLRAK